ncbi:hypothetical protein AGOR_G00119370 [Albula goreensis]|uniref:ZP domain-containing protein n=1 Tax=Albula goreensis TaxID=1534307 RepID=A0A8T3DF90_9TELE|nr:hypothetical protein AGOR_G00119370 [Albula goreensis]
MWWFHLLLVCFGASFPPTPVSAGRVIHVGGWENKELHDLSAEQQHQHYEAIGTRMRGHQPRDYPPVLPSYRLPMFRPVQAPLVDVELFRPVAGLIPLPSGIKTLLLPPPGPWLGHPADRVGNPNGVEIENGRLVYSNVLQYIPEQQGEVIRAVPLTLRIHCSYDRFHYTYKVGYVPEVKKSTFFKSFKSVRTFSLVTCDENWERLSATESFVLGEPMYFKVIANSITRHERVSVTACHITSSRDPNSKPQMSVIENFGCMADSRRPRSRSMFHGYDTGALRFTIDAFLFPHSSSKLLYLHCDVTVGTYSPTPTAKSCTFNREMRSDPWRVLDGETVRTGVSLQPEEGLQPRGAQGGRGGGGEMERGSLPAEGSEGHPSEGVVVELFESEGEPTIWRKDDQDQDLDKKQEEEEVVEEEEEEEEQGGDTGGSSRRVAGKVLESIVK